MSLSFAWHTSKLGGVLKESFKDVSGLSTFPAIWQQGRPSAPVTDN